jgi:hypothetical protein
VDDASWLAWTATLTVLGAVWAVYAFRNRGVASGLRGAGIAMLPAAAYLTGTLEVFTEIGSSVTDWATHLVFSPKVWVGVVLAGVAALCIFVSGVLRERGRGGAPTSASRKRSRKQAEDPENSEDPRALERGRHQKGKPVIDDDMAEIEAILKKRGIS